MRLVSALMSPGEVDVRDVAAESVSPSTVKCCDDEGRRTDTRDPAAEGILNV